MTPFHYPVHFSRRHGPSYSTVESYRPWLRDEFTFRCVYCLQRERWVRSGATFAIDHVKPEAHHPRLATTYTNLVFSCVTCNSFKGDDEIPDPTAHLRHGSVIIDAAGVIRGTTPQARKIIRVLDLDGPDATAFRKQWLDILRMAVEVGDDEVRKYLGFPDDLPDLTVLRPDDNTRPAGVSNSYHAQRVSGDLPDVY